MIVLLSSGGNWCPGYCKLFSFPAKSRQASVISVSPATYNGEYEVMIDTQFHLTLPRCPEHGYPDDSPLHSVDIRTIVPCLTLPYFQGPIHA